MGIINQCYAFLFFALMNVSLVSTQLERPEGYRLEPKPTYLIIAPKKVYPNQIVQMQVSILQLDQEFIIVRASVHSEDKEYASLEEAFNIPATKYLQMRMLENADPGNYTLRVEGTVGIPITMDNETELTKGGRVFYNETSVIFSKKQMSMFITTDKPIYHQGQTVKVRIVAVKPNLLAMHGSMDVYAVDATGTVVRWWLQRQTNSGMVNLDMGLSDQLAYGTWTVRVSGFGHIYEKQFEVEEFFAPPLYVNVSMPPYIMEDDYGLAGVITANHTSGEPCRGEVTITLEIRLPPGDQKPNQTYTWPKIPLKPKYFHGRTDFLFTLEELKNLTGKLPAGQELYVHAEVHDWFLVQNSSGFAISIVHSNMVHMKLLGDRSRAFKPGFPVSVYYALVHADGTPLQRQRRQVSISRITRSTTGLTTSVDEEKEIVADNGIVHYNFVAPKDADFISIRAYYDTSARGSNTVECLMSRAFTANQVYVSITTSTLKPMVNEYMVFTIRTTIKVDSVHYIIAASGNIVVGSILEMYSRQKTFSIALSRDMVPSARILVYFIYNGEVITDALNFFVNGTRQNPVSVDVNLGKDFSKDTVELTGRTDPGAYMAFSGIDYDLYVYGGKEYVFVTENQIIEELETYDAHANGSFQHTWYHGEEVYQKDYYPAPTYGVDANTTFAYSGLVVFTNANVTRVTYSCNVTQGYLPCHDGLCFRIEERCDAVWNCEDGVDEMGCPDNYKDPYTPMIHRIKHLPRHYEVGSGDWLWRSHFVKPDGRIDLRGDVPKEPMSWVIGGLAISQERGFGVVPEPTRFQSTRYFYIRVEAPSLISRGEQVGVRVALFNYWEADLECMVTLHDSETYRNIMVEEYGYVASYAPRMTRGDRQTMVYVQAGKMSVIHMPVVAVGNHNNVTVRISATSFMGADYVQRTINIIDNGITNYFNTPYLLDLINFGSMMIPDFDIPVQEQFFQPGERRLLYVPGSAKANISIFGDVVGPGFFEPHLTAMNLLRKPYGSAEQTAFNFASNLYYLKYLKETDQMDQKVLKDALHYMNLDLQRVLSYYDVEGGYYSMFRDYRKPTPSLWVSAFILSALSNADEADWVQQMYIDKNMLNKVALWIVDQQDHEGAFSEPTGWVYDRKLMKNSTSHKLGPGYDQLSLTATVLISLCETQGLTGFARAKVDTSKNRAAAYVERFVGAIGDDPYQMALVTYALSAANSNKRNDALRKLDGMKRSTEYTYWSAKEIPTNPTKIVNTVHYMQPRNIYTHEARAVEATSYALMAYLRNNLYQDAIPIMKWINTMRNTIGGFASTKDSIVALKALIEFGNRDTNRDLYNVRVSLEATSSAFRPMVNLNRTNWIDAQFVQIPLVWGQVKCSAQGTGMVLMQLHTEVNVEHEEFFHPKPEAQFFHVDITNKLSGKNFSVIEMTMCPSWVRGDLAERTGMVVMEIGLPSGYIMLNDVLRRYVRSGEVPTLGRAEFSDRKLVFYFDYLEAGRPTCVSFRADRYVPIANMTIHYEVNIYDYYEPAIFNRTMFTMYDLHHLHICQVCGSYQCPYCPYYNSAPSTTGSTAFMVVMTLVVIVTIMRRPSWISIKRTM